MRSKTMPAALKKHSTGAGDAGITNRPLADLDKLGENLIIFSFL